MKIMKKGWYRVRWKALRGAQRFCKYQYNPKKYAKQVIKSEEETNEILIQLLKSDAPFMVARFGATELKNMVRFEKEAVWEPGRQDAMYKLHINSGFFPPYQENLYFQFAQLMKESCKQVDMLGVWFNPLEDYMIEEYMNMPVLTRLSYLEPWMSLNNNIIKEPWTKYLKGKKVLVIHPFAKIIEEQYRKRTEIYKGIEILPEYQLETLQAVQTLAGQQDDRFGNWFEALEWMESEALKKEFDIALVGCGAYGFPICAKIKDAGKQAIHMGGALQLMYGIKGKRWDNSKVARYFNDSWVRPGEHEKVDRMDLTENSCYW